MSQNLPADNFKWVKIKLIANLLNKKKECHTHEKFKTSINS